MKPYPAPPPLPHPLTSPPDTFGKLYSAAQSLGDDDYLHWEQLRHRRPPKQLSHEEWWWALKLRRQMSAMTFPALTARNGAALGVSRHPRLDVAVARMDRLLAGLVELPDSVRNTDTRDRFVASGLMEEAIHSSLFEGAVSTREVAKEMLRSDRRPISRDERMILNNYRAMERIREVRNAPMSVELLLELHRILTEDTLDRPEYAGRIQRPDEPRIQVVDHRLHRVVHDPPAAAELPARLERLVDFANADDIANGLFVHPVLRSILLHFQLAYDHPFHDGNGRTARALFYWSMLKRGYWLTEYVSISRLLFRHRKAYEQAFLFVESDDQDATYFVLQQLDVLGKAVDELFAYVARKSQDQRRLVALLKGRDDLNHRQLALLDHALRKPDAEYTHESHGSSHRVTTVTARSDLRHLVKLKFLSASRRGKRIVYRPRPGLEARLRGG